MSVRLGRFMEGRCVLPATQFACRKGLGTCDGLLCVAHSLQSASEIGQEARIVQRTTIRGFSSSSVLWELVVQCCLFGHSFSLIGHSMSWCMVVVANWLTWCQGCPREVFWALSCSSCTLQSFSLMWKTSSTVMLTTPLWWLLCRPLVRG